MKREPSDEFARRRAERRRRIKRRRLIIFFIVFIMVMLAVGIALSLTVFFPIESITASGSKIYTPEQIVSACSVKKGDNLFAFSKDTMTENMRKKLPYVESVQLKRSLPGSIKITVKDSKEYACYNVDGAFYVTNANGFVLNKYESAPENIVEIHASKVKCKVGSNIQFGDKKSEEIIKELVSELNTDNINTNYIDVTDSVSITAKVEGRFTVDFGTSNNLEKKAAHLAGMIKSIDASKSGKINLSMWTSDRTEGTFTEETIE